MNGPDPDNHTDVGSSRLMDVIVEYWGRNTVHSSGGYGKPPYSVSVLTSTSVAEPMPLANVTYWAYQIQDLGRRACSRSSHTSAANPASPTNAMAAQVCGMPSTGTKSTAPSSAPRQPPTRSAA